MAPHVLPNDVSLTLTAGPKWLLQMLELVEHGEKIMRW
ncbi:hypothetical protein BIW11_02604 [Tropilaelaps mercedesae]|uniref:Uncharacterized protein n=1 Tax=Tropilaelaps mercedesae TaxID=418985 RepID=A0A1V9Y0C2_9ACAR|nr:hypothetical protein BIW11_02604 [Tropilaelaps mercedesae]